MENQRGSFLVIAAVSLAVMFAVVAIGIEVGRWYTVRSEISKAVDAASLVGAKNSSNPYLDPEVLTKQVAEANFQDGLLGTDSSPNFDVTLDSTGKVSVVGETQVVNTVGRTMAKEAQPEQLMRKRPLELRGRHNYASLRSCWY